MIIDAVMVVAGLALLAWAADRFVVGAAGLSTIMKISPVVVGAVVIGFSTSMPELVVSVLAALDGTPEMAFGNITGSNIANVLLVLGVAGLVAPLAVRRGTLQRELPLMLIGSGILAAVTFNGSVTRVGAIGLLAGGLVLLAVLVYSAMTDKEERARMETEVAQAAAERPRLGPAVAWSVVGLAGTLVGAQLLVMGATGVAAELGVPEFIIGVTIVAIGTSLPELVTAVAAARRGETDLIIGNVLGSNIFNALLVAGAAGVFGSVQMAADYQRSLAVMCGSAVLVALMLITGRRLTRVESGILLVLFAPAMVWVMI